jgi:nucleoside-diphosphate-sugar epimerase
MIDWRAHFPEAFAGSRVCVTGGAGFIGSHLVDALVDIGADVVVIDDLSTGSVANLAASAGRITLLRESILRPERWAGAVAGCRQVFHLAALGSVPRSIVEPELYQEVNALGTLRVLQVAREAGVERVVFSGSSSAYGDAPGADTKSETMPPLPRSPYAATKLAGEHLMRAWSCSYGLDTAVLRYFNIFGPRQNGASAYAAVIAAFATAMQRGSAGTIFGDGRQTRDFTFVANAVYANLLAAAHPGTLGGEVFNVATGHAASLLELHGAMAGAWGLTGAEPTFLPARAGDVAWSRADISRAREVLGYRPLVSFEDGLGATVRAYQSVAGRGCRGVGCGGAACRGGAAA